MTWILIVWFARVGDYAPARGHTIGPFSAKDVCVELSLAIENAGRGTVHAACAPAGAWAPR